MLEERIEKKIWLITDTHFGHKNIIKYCGRPNNFEKLISKNLFKSVKWNDILIHLGDVALGDRQFAHNKYIKPLQCKKWLLLGNHDTESISWYLENGWDFVAESFTAVYFGKRILFSHKPMPNGDYDINVHGHFHNNSQEYWEPDLKSYLGKKHLLLSIESQDYNPITLKDFLSQNSIN